MGLFKKLGPHKIMKGEESGGRGAQEEGVGNDQFAGAGNTAQGAAATAVPLYVQ